MSKHQVCLGVNAGSLVRCECSKCHWVSIQQMFLGENAASVLGCQSSKISWVLMQWVLFGVMKANVLGCQRSKFFWVSVQFNPLNAELNPICHFLALLGAHHILHVSRIRVKCSWV